MEIEERTLKFREEVLAALAAIREQNTSIFKRLDNLDRTINGNGHPGLKERVTALENNWRWAKWIAAAIGAAASILCNYIINFLK